MSLLKRRNLRFVILVVVVLLVLLVSLLFLSGNTVYRSWCACAGQWSEGVCHWDWGYTNELLQAPYPFCYLRGVHSDKWICIGSQERHPIYSGNGTFFDDICHGLEIDLEQCYGIPYSASPDNKGGPISCNYPCDDEQILEACKTQDVIRFDKATVSCVQLENWCK